MNIVGVQQFENRLRETEDLLKIRPDQRIPVVYDRSSDQLGRHLFTIFILAAIIGYLIKKVPVSVNISSAVSFFDFYNVLYSCNFIRVLL